jgi:hypothetical protein
MRFAPTNTSIRCPFCGAPITVSVQSAIDALDQPELKARLLTGRLNTFTCPNCRNVGALAAPFIYHDASKEMALIFLPMEGGLNQSDQQKIIGQMTQAVMNSVPPEKRKAYLLQPQQFFRLQTLIEEILRADGVTPDMIQAQQAKADLLRRLIETQDDAAFEAAVKENDAHIDGTFFQLMALAMANAEADNRPNEFNRLATVRDRLLDLTAYGQTAKKRAEAIDKLVANMTREGLLEQLVAAPDSETREALLAVGRPLLDYPFFQQLTARIDAAKKGGDTAEADRLTGLRKEILELRDKLDAQAQQVIEQRATLLRELMISEDLNQAASAQAGLLDDMFFNILASEMQAAQQAGDSKTVERLRQVGNAAMQVVQRMQPPEVQFVNALLSVEYPNQTRELLERNRQALVPEFIDWLGTVEAGLREDGRAESADRLAQVIVQARELAGVPTNK